MVIAKRMSLVAQGVIAELWLKLGVAVVTGSIERHQGDFLASIELGVQLKGAD